MANNTFSYAEATAFAAQLILWMVFLIAACSKLLQRQNTINALAQFGVPTKALVTSSVVLPAAEGTVAVLLLFPSTALVASVLAALLLGAFGAAISLNLARGNRPKCSCFGLTSRPIDSWALVRNATLCVLTAIFAYLNDIAENQRLNAREYFAAATLATLSVAFGAGWFKWHSGVRRGAREQSRSFRDDPTIDDENHRLRGTLINMLSGSLRAQAVSCAAEFGIADHLATGPKTVEELATATRCSAPHLRRLMRALCAAGLFQKHNDRYAMTALGALLRRDADNSLWPAASFFGRELYRAYSALADTVRTGQPGWNSVTPLSFWEYLENHPDRAKVFDDSQGSLSAVFSQRIVDAYPFDAYGTVVDVGGGNGQLLATILQRAERVTGVLFDKADVIHESERTTRGQAWRTRCRFEAGDFLRSVPSGGDLYLLRHVLHNWNDEQAVQILRNCAAVAGADAVLLIAEEPLADDNSPSAAAWIDLAMMINFGGQERSLDHYKVLLAHAGYTVTKVVKTLSPISLIEARRATSVVLGMQHPPPYTTANQPAAVN